MATVIGDSSLTGISGGTLGFLLILNGCDRFAVLVCPILNAHVLYVYRRKLLAPLYQIIGTSLSFLPVG